MHGALGETEKQATWAAHAKSLEENFIEKFWRDDHFGEYIHPDRGLVDSHGLSDVNWAAVAFDVAKERHLEVLWPKLMNEPNFWRGDMPTQSVTEPFTYNKWEYEENWPVHIPNPLQDVAAMGRVWYLEATACKRMKEYDRLKESVRKVYRAMSPDGYWCERYHPTPEGGVIQVGARKYCEYAAVLTRVVLDNLPIFRQ